MLVVDVIAERLRERGVRFVFGMPGGATVPLMAALDSLGIEFVLVRREGSAGLRRTLFFSGLEDLGSVLLHLVQG